MSSFQSAQDINSLDLDFLNLQALYQNYDLALNLTYPYTLIL